MLIKQSLAVRYTVSLALYGLTVFLGYYAKRTDFWPFLAAYGAFFGLYWWVCQHATPLDNNWYLGLGILLRVILLFAIPHFSDDMYRFLWDGRLLVAGIHPFAHPPVYFIDHQVFPPGITPELFAQLNSPRYFTVYPPVCQAVFALAAWLAPHSIQGGVMVMKLFLLLCEIGTLYLLTQLQTPPSPNPSSNFELRTSNLKPPPSPVPTSNFELQTSNLKPPPSPGSTSNFELQTSNSILRTSNLLLYALNPLFLLEIIGNCHFEGAMIFFLIAGLLALQHKKTTLAAGMFALAVASKLVPLLFVPLVWARLDRPTGRRFVTVFGVVSLLVFAPMLNWEVLTNMARSIDLYFQKFQFNASVYYLLRAVGFWIKGYDTGYLLGPMLGLVVVGYVMRQSWRSRVSGTDWIPPMLFVSLVHLTAAATVHAWYVTLPLVLGILTPWWRVVVVWSGMVVLSYSHYANGAFQENYWLIAVEYAIVGWAFFSGKIKKG